MSSGTRLAVVALISAGVGFGAGTLSSSMPAAESSRIEVTHRCENVEERGLVRVHGETLPPRVAERMTPVDAHLKSARGDPEKHELYVRLDSKAPTGRAQHEGRLLTFREATLTVESHEAAPGNPSRDYGGAWYARVTYRLHVVLDVCEGVEPLEDLMARGWPGPCGYVHGDRVPEWLIRREFLVRRERLESPNEDGTRGVMERFQGRCVPLGALGASCKMEGGEAEIVP